mgnify:CR=1 FL=1
MSICIEHIRKQFGAFKALDDISLDIRSGELLALLGDLLALGAPDVVDGCEHPTEGGHPVAVLGREVGAAPERDTVGGHVPTLPAGDARRVPPRSDGAQNTDAARSRVVTAHSASRSGG